MSRMNRNICKRAGKSRRIKETSKDRQATKNQTVADAAATYLDTISIRVKQSTYSIYRGYVQSHISPYFNGVICADLTQKQVQAFVNTLIKNGLAASTAKCIISLLKAALTPICGLQIFEVVFPKHKTSSATVLSMAEQRRLEYAIQSSNAFNRIGVTLCLYTGIRVGELCGLAWDDVDLERGELHIRRTIERIAWQDGGAKTKIIALPPKSNSSNRVIPLQSFLINMLAEHRDQNPGKYVLSFDDKPMEPRNFQRRFKRLLFAANIQEGSCHSTRHSFSTRALEQGFDIKTLSEILGHSSAKTTLNCYAHSINEHKRNAMESLSALRRS